MADYLVYAAALLLASLVTGLILPWPLAYHPLSFFAAFCRKLALKVHPDFSRPASQQRLSGLLALLLVLALPLCCWYGLYLMSSWPLLLDAIVILCSFSWPASRSLAQKISRNLHKQQVSLARSQMQLLLLRDTQALSAMGLAKALLESLALRFQQQFTAIIIWYLLAGAPGVLVCRLSQVASQQWSTKLESNQHFGKAAERLAAFFNAPAYLLGTALFWLQGRRQASAATLRADGKPFSYSKRQLLQQLSHTLRVSLGGPAHYGNKTVRRDRLQQNYEPTAADIHRLLQLLDYQLYTQLFLLAGLVLLLTFISS
ncbi:cobalamin biosynthesis protein [Alishewanella jeotgali]|uniref:Cobalamin biosynthesis protein CbiB n=1 Tax=Alishewanella jeotgali KCTC 22429 TaxID=1129374 RepID=H3ZC12_9ALTE|nr:cobalamin biosynthesis protein [Alishewanella jeotgali]EHR41857.1 cobalamin biosynthesis protein CbiB [Alishewanella jeotgali KCTC 22429]